MNATFLITLLLTAALFFSLGYFLSSVALSQSIRNDLAALDRERADLADERDALNIAWLSGEPPADVVFALDERRRITREVT
jgi:hypothetical protein